MKFLALALTLVSPALAGAASPERAVAKALADCRQLDPARRLRVRYLTLYHADAGERVDGVKGLNYLVNSISRAPDIVRLHAVDVDLWRIVLDEYEWDAAVWEAQAGTEPYFRALAAKQEYGHFEAGKWVTTEIRYEPIDSLQELAQLTGSAVPIVRADWFWINAIRQLSLRNQQTGHGYYDWLGIKDRKTFRAITQRRLRDKELRAIVDDSGVATHNRQIALLEGTWVTLDVDDDQADKNAIRNPRKGDYRHQAEEHYGFLPNELPAVLLCDQDGNRQDTAPDFIGADTTSTSNDKRIHVLLSCARCHKEILRPIDDWARRNAARLELQFADLKTALDIRRQYLQDLDKRLGRDRQVYAEALAAANGLTPEENAKLVRSLWQRWADAPRSLERAAAELGVPAAQLKEALGRTPNIDPVLGGLLTGPARVSQWEEVYPIAWQLVRSKQ